MSQVLYRKYRPQNFSEVLAQETVKTVLKNAIKQGRVSHAYLFTGPRGVGKTTIARILAKAINCLSPKGGEPCGKCDNCLLIAEGRFLDLFEIDAASYTGVDNIREIIDGVKFSPTRGKYKVFIIDEVHMLSTSAFNALLKTLEEPPPHVLFVFATTDWQKIPATILSRCQRYDFRRISTVRISTSLREIADREKIKVSDESLRLLAREAEGSLRDAESLLDQAIAYAGNEIPEEALRKMFGFLDRDQVFSLLESVVKGDAGGALTQFGRFFEMGADLNRLVMDVLNHLRLLLLLRAASPSATELDLSESEWSRLKELSKLRSTVEWDHLFQLATFGGEDVMRSSYPKMVFEVLIVRLAQSDLFEVTSSLLENQKPRPEVSAGNPAPVRTAPVASPAKPEVVANKDSQKSWSSFLEWLEKQKPQLASIFQHGTLVSCGNSEVVFSFGPKEKVYAEMLSESERKEQVCQWMKTFFGNAMSFSIVDTTGKDTLLQTPCGGSQTHGSQTPKAEARKQVIQQVLNNEGVRAAADILGARVEEVRPLAKEWGES